MLTMIFLVAHTNGARAQQRYVLSGHGEWGGALDRRHSGVVSEGSNASNRLFQLSFRGPLAYGIRFSTSGSFSQWYQESHSVNVPSHVGRTNSLSNSLYVPLINRFNLTVHESRQATTGQTTNSRRLLGGTITGRPFASGPDITLQAERVAQSETIAGRNTSDVSYHQSFKLSRTTRTFLYQAEEMLNRQQAANGNGYTSTLSSNVRLLKWLSAKSRTSGAFSLTSSPGTFGHAGNLSFAHEFTSRRSFDIGLNYAGNRGSSSDSASASASRSSVGGALTGRSAQSLGWRMDHVATVSARGSLQRSDDKGEDFVSSIAVDNDVQRPLGSWRIAVGATVALERAAINGRDVGTRTGARVSAVRSARMSQTRVSYTVDQERVTLHQTRQTVTFENRRYLSRSIALSLGADAQLATTQIADTAQSGATRQYSVQGGLEFRGSRRSLSLVHQYHHTRGGSLVNERHSTSASLTMPLWTGARLDADGQMQFERANDLRNLNAQMSIVWPVAALELSLTSRLYDTRSHSARNDGSYVGFKVGRNFLKAW